MSSVLCYSSASVDEWRQRVGQNLQLGKHCGSIVMLSEQVSIHMEQDNESPLMIVFNTHGSWTAQNGAKMPWSIPILSSRNTVTYITVDITPDLVWNGFKTAQFEWKGWNNEPNQFPRQKMEWSIPVVNAHGRTINVEIETTPDLVDNGFKNGQFQWDGLKNLLAQKEKSSRIIYIIFGQCYGWQFAEEMRVIAATPANVNIHGISALYTRNIPMDNVFKWQHAELSSLLRLLKAVDTQYQKRLQQAVQQAAQRGAQQGTN